MFLVLLGADPAAGRLQVPQQAASAALARDLGLGVLRRAASCRRWSSASPSAICFSACPSISIETLRFTYEGDLLGLLNPFALLCGLVSVAMLTMHGAAWLAGKSRGRAGAARARGSARVAALALVVAASRRRALDRASASTAIASTRRDRSAPAPPIRCGKRWRAAPAAGSLNYARHPLIALAPVAGLARRARGGGRCCAQAAAASRLLASSAVASRASSRRRAVSLFPFLLPSSIDPEPEPDGVGRLVQPDDAGHHARRRRRSSCRSCWPIPSWVYRVLRGPVTEAAIEHGDRPLLLRGERRMWYFSWVLGLGLACAFGILNAMWLELDDDDEITMETEGATMRRAHLSDYVAGRRRRALISCEQRRERRDGSKCWQTDRMIRIAAGLVLLSLVFVGPQTMWGFSVSCRSRRPSSISARPISCSASIRSGKVSAVAKTERRRRGVGR